MAGKRYTDEELAEITEMYTSGRPVDEIAAKFNRGRESINNIVQRLGIHRKREKYDVVQYSNSKCWSCAKSLNYGTRTCEWASRFEPVPGWDAEIKGKGYYNTAIHDSYFVKACPKYEYQEHMDDLERAAIRANEEQAPFYNLLAAVYKLMTEEYWSCCKTITTVNRPLNEKDDAASRLIYLREFFKNTKALPILEKHTARHDWVMQYLETYQWRTERRRKR